MCDMHDNLDDSLDGLWEDFGLTPDPDKAARVAALPKTTPVSSTFTEDCGKCRGTGRFFSYSGRNVGPCHACKGTGKLTFKSSPEERARARASKERREASQLEEWIANHAQEWEWIVRRAGSFDFAGSMREAVTKYRRLTDNQLAAVRRCMVRDAERAERFATERHEREANAVSVDISKVQTALNTAYGNKVRWPKLRLATYIFTRAGDDSRNPGSVYVTRKDDKLYLGKITDGKFIRSRDCTSEQEVEIVEAASNPEAAAKAYGQRFGACSICGRELTVKESIDRSMGPICAEKYGWA